MTVNQKMPKHKYGLILQKTAATSQIKNIFIYQRKMMKQEN